MSYTLKEPRRLTPDEIIDAVCAEFGVTKGALCGDSRVKWLCVPRHVCSHIAVRDFGYSAPAIGRALKKDHSTILSALDSIVTRMAVDYDLAARVARLRTTLERKAKQPVPPAPILMRPVKPPEQLTLAELLARIPDVQKVKRSAMELKNRGWSANGIARRLGLEPRVAAHLIGINWENAA